MTDPVAAARLVYKANVLFLFAVTAAAISLLIIFLLRHEYMDIALDLNDWFVQKWNKC